MKPVVRGMAIALLLLCVNSLQFWAGANTAILWEGYIAGSLSGLIAVLIDPRRKAFVTGRRPEDASLALSTALVRQLNPSELSVVILHELAHLRKFSHGPSSVAVRTLACGARI
jgi:hypothetical protein